VGQSVSISVKALALSVLSASKPVPVPALSGTDGGTNSDGIHPLADGARHGHAALLAPCGSPDCAGCYDVGEGRKIHPPRCGGDYRAWLERWEAKGRPQ